VIAKMMAKNKSERYASAADVIDALSPWLPAAASGNIVRDPLSTQDLKGAGVVTEKKRKVKSGKPKARGSRQKTVLVACGLAGAIVVGLLIAVLGGSKKPDRAKGPETSTAPAGGAPNGAAPNGGAPNGGAPKWLRHVPVPLDQYGTATADRPLFYNNSNERYMFSSWREREVFGVPFQLVGPQDGKVRNILLLRSSMLNDGQSSEAPEAVTLPVNRAAAAVHFLGGVGGWAWPYRPNNLPAEELRGKVVMTVRLKYKDGQVEEHPMRNGEHIADWIRKDDVSGSKFAFQDDLGHQVRYLSVVPRRAEVISEIELAKGELSEVAPIVLAVTVEGLATAAGPKNGN
jgi:hypothetical protein